MLQIFVSVRFLDSRSTLSFAFITALCSSLSPDIDSRLSIAIKARRAFSKFYLFLALLYDLFTSSLGLLQNGFNLRIEWLPSVCLQVLSLATGFKALCLSKTPFKLCVYELRASSTTTSHLAETGAVCSSSDHFDRTKLSKSYIGHFMCKAKLAKLGYKAWT